MWTSAKHALKDYNKTKMSSGYKKITGLIKPNEHINTEDKIRNYTWTQEL